MSGSPVVIAQICSVILFAGYGMHAILSERMVAEFKRYGLARFRVLTGVLQVAGSLGIVGGQFFRPLLLVSAGGLTVMMFLGVITRIRVNDPLYAAIPALLLCAVNLFIFISVL